MRQPIHSRAFTFVEVLVAASIAAAVITVGVMIYQNLTLGLTRTSTYGDVTIGAAAVQNFYNAAGARVNGVFFAPNYGRAAQADFLRERFNDDLQHANAVFCLGRNGLNNTRPTAIPVGASFWGRSVDTPEAFRLLLAQSIPSSAGTFVPYRGALTSTNATIFILQPSATTTDLSVRATYDIDLTPSTDPKLTGTYVSVRRYEGDILSRTEYAGGGTQPDYYDVFFPSGAASIPFNPLLVCFERAARNDVVEGEAIDRFKKAANRPFYFVWWPDPASRWLEGDSAGAYSASDPRAAYAGMGGRTSYFFVVPMFPAL